VQRLHDPLGLPVGVGRTPQDLIDRVRTRMAAAAGTGEPSVEPLRAAS